MKINRREIMKRAHEIAKKMVGDWYARLSLALRQAWREAKNMTKELIRKYSITLYGDGQIKVPNAKKLTKKERDQLVVAKPEILAELNRQEQEKAEVKAKKLAEQQAEKLAILAGEKIIKVRYHDGEYLSGHSVSGQAADILVSLGVAKHVSGWGCHVDMKVVDALGQEFTYQQVMDYLQPEIEAKLEAHKEKVAKVQAKFDEARETGKPVLLRSWSTDCCDPREECSTDNHYEYAMPDGTVKHAWNHTW